MLLRRISPYRLFQWHAVCRLRLIGSRGKVPRTEGCVPARGDHSMDIIIWLVVGGVVGWLASLLMKTDARQGIFLNVIVGIIGAALAGFFISPMVGLPTINQGVFSFGSLLVSLVGAVILLAIVNLFRRGTVR
jgi:uncharacterized membrane protein YeaQ/YmgE (transglycosylase-associated protein family)